MVYYDSRDITCKQPFGALKAGQTATFTLSLHKTAQAGLPFMRVVTMDFWDAPTDIPMELTGGDMVYNRYTCKFTPAQPALLAYSFVFRQGGKDGWERHVRRGGDGLAVVDNGSLWQLTVYDNKMQTPDCLGEGVMYQIFPDRFRNSGKPKKGVPNDRLLRSDWGGMPVWKPDERGEVTNSDYFCGDLAGIEQKLPYLAELGVSCIYLNPIFEAHSNHRYNTADYSKIDPLLGDNSDFARLCEKAKEMGISIILDGVFSHTGSDSIYFNKEGRYNSVGAFNDPCSPYLNWYQFLQYPDDYASWWGFKTLPNVEEENADYLDFICGEDGIARGWMRMGAAGFRLDVADELPDRFLDLFKDAVKAENPHGAVIGEVWEDASNKVAYGQRRRYLLGRQLDSVMNYPFKDAILRYIRYGGGGDLYNTIMQILENYPQPVIAGLMNSLSTHDTPRAITVLACDEMGGEGREWQAARHNLTPAQYALGRQLLLLAMVLQFGLPGMPCVYYGDEAGMYGYKDPFNRGCYPWGNEDGTLLDAVKALGRIRSKYPVFSGLDFQPLVFADEVCAFLRADERHIFLFAVNRGGEAVKLLNLTVEGEPEVLFTTGGYAGGTLLPGEGVALFYKK